MNDVELMHALLMEERYAFPPAAIKVLKDQEATRAHIMLALEELAVTAARDDVLLFYFSGHGSQVLNSKSTEKDRRDETIVPADAIIGVHDIRDKELRRIFNRILDRGAKLTVILDSCHSASGGRGTPGGLKRAVLPESRDAKDGEDDGPRPENRGAVIIAAAQDDDLAWETTDSEGKQHGAFSYAFARALLAAGDDETLRETFASAEARLRADRPDQTPVLAGVTAAQRPFVDRRTKAKPRAAVAVEKVDADGTIFLRGGWINGLTVGSELKSPGDHNVRIAVSSLTGYGRSEARRLKTTPIRSEIKSGDLFELTTWSAPPTRPLRVWMPSSNTPTAPFVHILAAEAPKRAIQWVEDPVRVTPSHLLRWRGARWELITKTGSPRLFEPEADPSTVLAGIPNNAKLFVQIPASGAVASKILISLRSNTASIQSVLDPDAAEYALMGHLAGGRIEYAWIRLGIHESDALRGGLPARSAWLPESAELGNQLRQTILKLRRIHGWHVLESPPGARATYNLAIQSMPKEKFVNNGRIVGGGLYRLVLRSNRPPAEPSPRRYFYAFVVDNSGRGILLHPISGSVENHFPLDPKNAPREIPLDTTFEPTAPWGVDTYFLLTTDEPLVDPWVLEWDGITTRDRKPSTPLGELLLSTGAPTRTVKRYATPPQWSIERLIIEAVRPGKGAHA